MRHLIWVGSMLQLLGAATAFAAPPIDLTSSTAQDLFHVIAKGDAVWGLTNCTVTKGILTVGSLPQLGNTQTFGVNTSTSNANQGSSSFRNITIIGDRLSAMRQMGLTFYGKTTFAYLDDIVISFMNGRALWAGAANNGGGFGDFNESVVQNARFEDDGATNFATIEITSAGTAEGSNALNLHAIRIFQPFGPGIWIHNPSTSTASNNARDIRLSDIMIEGSEVSRTSSGGDLLEIGDPAASGNNVTNVIGRNILLVNPVQGFAAIRIAGDLPTDTFGIDITGSIVGALADPGRGVQVETCGGCSFKLAQNTAADYMLVVGRYSVSGTCKSSDIASPGIVYDGAGSEALPSFASCIDSAIATPVEYPQRSTPPSP